MFKSEGAISVLLTLEGKGLPTPSIKVLSNQTCPRFPDLLVDLNDIILSECNGFGQLKLYLCKV